ncbi:MAG: hypothetical protein ACLP50_25235 [Solirubrobacteraceae bacterium]
MLLKHRPPGIDTTPPKLRPGLEHLDASAVSVLRWLNANKVDYVLVGPVAHAVRGDLAASGPVAIVPAPYDRNFERLTRALVAERAGLRSDRALAGTSDRAPVVAVKLTADKLARGRRWMLRFGAHDLDLEGAGRRPIGPEHPIGAGLAASAAAGGVPGPATSGPRYQELLYEAHRFTLADNLTVEVASTEDLEHFSHVRRTGTAPEFKVTRNEPQPAADGDVHTVGGDSVGGDGAGGEATSSAQATAPAGGAPAEATSAEAAPAADLDTRQSEGPGVESGA